MHMQGTPEQIAWAAGVFEGEGCIIARANTSGELIIGMTDRDVLERFHEIVGVGTITTELRKPPHSTCYRWSVSNARDCTMVLEALLPWFCERRTAVATALLERMKACRADDCRWAFLDTSKNRSRAWCSMESCGNRAKVHTYRQRHHR